MEKKQSNPAKQALVKSILLAMTFMFLGIFWEDNSPVVRISFVAAGVAFAIEGIIQYKKAN